MRYADEFPRLRGWIKKDAPQAAWAAYQEKRATLGDAYIQLIIRLGSMPIGESFFVPLPQGFTFGKWQKPSGTLCAMGDIKLLPACWGRGLGAGAMQQVVAWVFAHTGCALLLVPPHRKNPAAQRVYERAGFELYTGMRSKWGHKVMTLRREAYTSMVKLGQQSAS